MEYPDTVKKLPSHVKYLQIMPEEAIIHADLLPVIPLSSLKIEKLENVTVQYYRFLYNQTGGPWLWTDRRYFSDERLLSIITASDLSIHVLKVDGVEAGYFELEWKMDEKGVVANVEVSYFGLMPQFIGKRIGPWFLDQLLTLVRDTEPQARIWVHTCSWDHPKALQTYMDRGFKLYKDDDEFVEVPSWYSPPVVAADGSTRSS